MSTIKVIDLGKSSFHFVGHDYSGQEQFIKKLRRVKLIQFLSQVESTIIAMESCSE